MVTQGIDHLSRVPKYRLLKTPSISAKSTIWTSLLSLCTVGGPMVRTWAFAPVALQRAIATVSIHAIEMAKEHHVSTRLLAGN
jgi:hypothetical protein